MTEQAASELPSADEVLACRRCTRDYRPPASPDHIPIGLCSRRSGCLQLATRLRHRARIRAYTQLMRRHLAEWREIYAAQIARVLAEEFPDPATTTPTLAAPHPEQPCP